MPSQPGTVLLNRFRRVPTWLRTALALQDDVVPEGLFLPGVVPTIDIGSVATRPVFASVALVAGTITQLPDIDCVAFSLQAPSGNGLNTVLLGGPGAAGTWEIATGNSLALSLFNVNTLFATMSAGAGTVQVLALQAV